MRLVLALALQTALAVGPAPAAFPPGSLTVDRAVAAPPPQAQAPAAADVANGGAPALAIAGSGRRADASSGLAPALILAGPGFPVEHAAAVDPSNGDALARAIAGAGLPIAAPPTLDASNAESPAIAVARSAVSVQDSAAAAAALEAATRSVASALRCPVCQGLSIEDSPTELAREMRAVVRQRLAIGRTADEVKAYFVSKYGEWILLEPEPEGFNLAVYLLPLVALLGGGGLIAIVVRRWTQPRAAADEPRDDATEADPGIRAGV